MLKHLLFAAILTIASSAHAQRGGIDRYMEDMTRLTFEGKNVPIKAGVVFCLAPASISPAIRGYDDRQLSSLGCVRAPRELTGFVVRVFRVVAAYEQQFIAQIQLPLPNNTVEIVWVYTSDLAK